MAVELNFTVLVFGILFLAFGAATAMGLVHTHLKDWKAMSQEEKDKIDVAPLCHNIGAMIIFCGIIFTVKGIFYGLSNRLFLFFVLVWIALCAIDLMQMGKKGWYIKDDRDKAALAQQRADIAMAARSGRRALPGRRGRK